MDRDESLTNIGLTATAAAYRAGLGSSPLAADRELPGRARPGPART
jgi:hypothetical protein